MTQQGSDPAECRVAYFISPHGYGHAARASAVMAAIHQHIPALRFEIFTQVPSWFFQDSVVGPFGYHPLMTDIGMVQKTSMAEDLPETLQRLDRFLPFDVSQIREIAGSVNRLGCQLAICDIAPMGIAVAREAGIPSILIENFTWDWIYEGYEKHAPGLRQHIAYLEELFGAADYHVQTRPVCRPHTADLTTEPVSRKANTSAQQIRDQLGISSQAKMVMLTMGGIPWRYTFLEHLKHQNGIYFVIPGADRQAPIRHDFPSEIGGLVLLPHQSEFFHPDLVNAADAVIGKAGYSTVSEVYAAGIPFGYIGRSRFRETQTLTAFIEQEMKGLPITETSFHDGQWLSSLRDLLEMPRIHRNGPNGADEIAGFICKLLAVSQS